MTLVLTLVGCSTVSNFSAKVFGIGTRTTDLKGIKVVSETGANDDTAVALDLLFIYDGDVADALPKNSPNWFNDKQDLQIRLGNKLDVVSLQVPPGDVIDKVKLPKRAGEAVKVLVFANYLAKGGQVPIELTEIKKAVIYLEPKLMSVK